MGIPIPCDDTPSHLWLSDFSVARPGGNQQGKSRFPWTPALEARALAMREAGDTWREVALALADMTGVRLTDHGLQDYLMRHYTEA